MSTNVSFEYSNAEKIYLQAITDEEKLKALEEMIKFMPKHLNSRKIFLNL